MSTSHDRLILGMFSILLLSASIVCAAGISNDAHREYACKPTNELHEDSGALPFSVACQVRDDDHPFGRAESEVGKERLVVEPRRNEAVRIDPYDDSAKRPSRLVVLMSCRESRCSLTLLSISESASPSTQ